MGDGRSAASPSISAVGVSPAWFVSGLGLALIAVTGLYFYAFGLGVADPIAGPADPAVELGLSMLEVVLMVGFAVATIAAGVWLHRSRFTTEQQWWVVLWVVMGLAGVSAVVVLVQFNQLLDGRQISRQTMLEELLIGAGGGSIVGFFTGLTNAELRLKRSEVESQRDAFEALNDFLRHNVLNGMQHVLGYADLLTPGSSEEDRGYLETITTRGEEIVFVVQNARALTEAIAREEPRTTVDLSAVLLSELEPLAGRYEAVTVTRTIPEAVEVVAGEQVPVVVRSLLTTLFQEAEAKDPNVEVTLQRTDRTGLVSISTPAIPSTDGSGGSLATDEGEDGPESSYLRDELGIDLVREVVQREGGNVWIARKEGTDAVVQLEFPLAGGGS